ncbi:hypothetical protein NDU88_010570 [Pleurodeles waltl]|uniref:Uncharacterized protein n=1 Tax=Pleurodeles waltl TaxID=8319 RepID=A0AAV7S3N6_PLEWA|nr:hypothetical protein NDU88_010570 [Pleurodeles waltl]
MSLGAGLLTARARPPNLRLFYDDPLPRRSQMSCGVLSVSPARHLLVGDLKRRPRGPGSSSASRSRTGSGQQWGSGSRRRAHPLGPAAHNAPAQGLPGPTLTRARPIRAIRAAPSRLRLHRDEVTLPAAGSHCRSAPGLLSPASSGERALASSPLFLPRVSSDPLAGPSRLFAGPRPRSADADRLAAPASGPIPKSDFLQPLGSRVSSERRSPWGCCICVYKYGSIRGAQHPLKVVAARPQHTTPEHGRACVVLDAPALEVQRHTASALGCASTGAPPKCGVLDPLTCRNSSSTVEAANCGVLSLKPTSSKGGHVLLSLKRREAVGSEGTVERSSLRGSWTHKSARHRKKRKRE